MKLLPSMLAGALLLHAAELKPETAGAFDHYVKLTEASMQSRAASGNFLWLDQHPKEKTMVWMSQSFVIPQETLDHSEKIATPGGVIQHWLGAAYLETATLERVRDMLLDYASYKSFFKQHVLESKLVQRDSQRSDASLLLHKKQITQVALDVDLTSEYKALDEKRTAILSRSTRIREAPRSSKKHGDAAPPSANENGYLWRLNIYWRLEQSDVGVYAEIETIALMPATGSLHPARYLNGFQSFPRELTQAFIDGLETAFPAPRK